MATGPVYVATWGFGELACRAAWPVLASGGAAIDAIEVGANVVEEDPEIVSVGFGGLPNADGVVELDAAIMDGRTHSAGAVCALTGIRRPISVARRVMEKTPHVMLAGSSARRFALSQGFADADLLTDRTRAAYREWRAERSGVAMSHFEDEDARRSHDTIGLCALDAGGNLAVGCTTSGIAWKLPGRVGDSPIIGSGLYVDGEVGAAAATGNGDEMMKACLSFRVVTSMERGLAVQEACEEAIAYLCRKRPGQQEHGASVIALALDGSVGAAATAEGFEPGVRPWIYAVARGGEFSLCEGPYVG